MKKYLNEIAERLWSDHAAVMVGAGFSKNAKKNNPSQKDFPDWNELGDIFYKKVNSKEPGNEQRYLDVLELAGQVEATFDRSTLDRMLCYFIPDKDYGPSELHVDLLKLPWTDVFTTNYDTLLERANANIGYQKFETVYKKRELSRCKKPRIIKLHGSFPSGPFVITKEDYRKYPKDFAPFVNTVQQSLLENTLCLVGFSGNDPNFLQWIGWIRDNLGKDYSPKIFMIGIFDLSDAEKKLLEQRNIVLIDMSVFPDVNGDHAKAQKVFFDYIRSQKEKVLFAPPDNLLEWPGKQKFMYSDTQKETIQQLRNVINEWKKNRKTYPNWIILPEDRRNSLWTYTEYWISISTQCKKLEIPHDIEFIYELNWRLEKCLYPIFNDNINIYKSVIEKYNPFPDKLTIETASVIRDSEIHKNLDWEKIEVEWIELHISMMRFYREEGHLKEWENINNRIQQLYSILSPKLIAQVHYERCLYALFSLNITNVREQIRLWPINESLPFWEAKRAGLLAELGDINEAEKILEISLGNIRKQLNISPVLNDYSLVSRESYVMLLLRYVKDAKMLRHSRSEEREEIRKKFNERWNLLKQYKCDPWNEVKLFERSLERDPVYTPTTIEKHGFDIGGISFTHHFGTTDTEALAAYSFLRYCEEVGIPFRIPMLNISQKTAEGASKRITKYSPYLAITTFVRIGDSRIADAIFHRESIYKMTSEQVDELIEKYLEVLRKALPEIERGDTFLKNNFGIVLGNVIPEVLSRLCMKCSTNSKDKIFSFVKEIYSSSHKHKYKGIMNLVIRLLRSYSAQEQYTRLSQLLEFPIPNDLNLVTKDEYLEPFKIIAIDREYVAKFKEIHIEQSIINSLLEKADSNDSEKRKRAIHRIAELHKLNGLNENQIKEFSEALWSQTDESTGFPKNTDFYKFAFLKSLPHPNNINSISLFKDYIAQEKFPIQKTKAEKGISITGGDIPFCYELIGATKRPLSDNGIDWSEQEAVDIFYRLLEWWDADKEFVKKDNDAKFFGSTGDEFKKRFANLTRILNCVIIPRLLSPVSIKEELNRLLKELSKYDVLCVATHAASLCIFPEQRQDVFDKIELAILSKQEEKIEDGYNAIYQIFVLHNTNKIAEIPSDIWSYIVSPIRWRHYQSLINAMRLSISIVNNFPETIMEESLYDILFGLNSLIEETSLQNRQSAMDIDKRLDVRSLAASLTYTLYNYYLKNELPIPEIIEKWRYICSDIEEFSDIRNKWEN